ncbi:MAG: AbgT family transporter, partial [Eubacteriales bacterium]
MKHSKKQNKISNLVTKIGEKIPDPILIFVGLYCVVMALTGIFGGASFHTMGVDGGETYYAIPNMFSAENIRWIFNNALLTNWLGYAGGILGTILIVMLGIGVAEESGLLATLIRKMGKKVPTRFLPYALVFVGIMSNLASDAGYIILIPLAGILYVAVGKHPVIGMAAAFAGVSAGFSANLIPATVIDVIIGTNAQAFATGQNIPFVSYLGNSLNPFTMHYFFMVVSTVLLVFLGGFITNRFVAPKFENHELVIPADLGQGEFEVSNEEQRGLRWAGWGVLLSLIGVTALAMSALAPYVNEAGSTVTPYLDNIILLMTIVFFASGLFFGYGSGKFTKSGDVVTAMSKQMGGMGYVIVLTFFCYNFLALLSYTNLGTYITFVGAEGLQSMGLAEY